LFIFARNNPIKYTDPDGRWISEFEPDRSEAMYELMAQIAGYYKEFVVPTPGISHAGLQRIVKGANGEMWFTPDHYAIFIPITH
jgi:guanyl-specific ribonuclease Sa